MTNLVLAYDNLDEELGSFFQYCHKYVCDNIPVAIGPIISSIDSNDLNIEYLENTISELGGKPFVFMAFSHGSNGSLACDNTDYVSVGQGGNTHFFGNSIFYTFSCSSGKQLGPALIDNDCQAFIGYADNAIVIESAVNLFVDCATFGILAFFRGNSIVEAFVQMQDKYEDEIDNCFPQSDYDLIIDSLRHNLNALILLGKEDCQITDLYVS